MKLATIGAGYVGLVSSVCFAELGHEVVCLDLDAAKIAALSDGKPPIYEEGLELLLKRQLETGRLRFTLDWALALREAEIVFVAVGTPSSRRGDGYADLSFVFEAVRSAAPYLRNHAVVVLKSTVPVGTTRRVERLIREANPAACFDVASNPEFLRAGNAVNDFLNPERIILGADRAETLEKLENVYSAFRGKTAFVRTRPEGAELIKYAANTFLAAKISFINEMAHLCEAVGADVEDVRLGVGLDSRIGPHFLEPGPGFGGSCLPKDLAALIRVAQEHGSPCRILETVLEVNAAHKAKIIRKILKALGEPAAGKTLGVWGLTFKANTDDIRESPALTILPSLVERGVRVKVHDPMGMPECRKILPDLEYTDNLYAACEGADALCLMTPWEEYLRTDMEKARHAMKGNVFLDLRNRFSPETMRSLGFDYRGIGRGCHG